MEEAGPFEGTKCWTLNSKSLELRNKEKLKKEVRIQRLWFESGLTKEITPEAVAAVVDSQYTRPEKEKLALICERDVKAKIDIKNWQRMVLHLALNIGPNKDGGNADEEIKEEEQEDEPSEEDLNERQDEGLMIDPIDGDQETAEMDQD